jgi:hypothetical protein
MAERQLPAEPVADSLLSGGATGTPASRSTTSMPDKIWGRVPSGPPTLRNRSRAGLWVTGTPAVLSRLEPELRDVSYMSRTMPHGAPIKTCLNPLSAAIPSVPYHCFKPCRCSLNLLLICYPLVLVSYLLVAFLSCYCFLTLLLILYLLVVAALHYLYCLLTFLLLLSYRTVACLPYCSFFLPLFCSVRYVDIRSTYLPARWDRHHHTRLQEAVETKACPLK